MVIFSVKKALTLKWSELNPGKSMWSLLWVSIVLVNSSMNVFFLHGPSQLQQKTLQVPIEQHWFQRIMVPSLHSNLVFYRMEKI